MTCICEFSVDSS